MTPATKAIYRWMLKDYVRVSSMSEAGLFNDKDVEASLTKIEVVDFHQTVSQGARGLGRSGSVDGHYLALPCPSPPPPPPPPSLPLPRRAP